MVWEPFALAVVFGLLISAGIYFVVMWPEVAPDDADVVDAAAAETDAVATVPAGADAAPDDVTTDAPAADDAPADPAGVTPSPDAPASA